MNIWDTFKSKVAESVNHVADSVSLEVSRTRNNAADVVAQVGAGASITAAASVGASGNAYQKIQTVGADYRTWIALGVLILVVFYFILRRKK